MGLARPAGGAEAAEGDETVKPANRAQGSALTAAALTLFPPV